MTRTRQAGVIVATICGLALMGCGDENPASNARETTAQSSNAAGSDHAGKGDKAADGTAGSADDTNGDSAGEGKADRKDGTDRGRRSEQNDSPDGAGDKGAGESDADGSAGSGGSGNGAKTPSGSGNESGGDSGGSGGSSEGDSGSTPDGGSGSDSPAPSEEPGSGPDDSDPGHPGHPGPAWTPDTLISGDLPPADGYAVANEEDKLDRPSIADPCRTQNLASEQAREDRRLIWWSPDGKQGSSPVIAVDGVSYPAGGAAEALQEIRDRVNSCKEQSYGDGSTLKLSMADTAGLVSDSVVVEMELSGDYSGTGRAIYQHVDDMVVVTFAMYELADSDRANQLVTELAQDYAEQIQAGP